MGFFTYLFQLAVAFVEELGRIWELFWDTLRWLPRRPYRLRQILKQCEEVGVRSAPVVLITSFFTGAVLALQSYSAFARFNAESLIGTVVAMSMTRELGPVLTGVIVAGRAGSAMAAELGTMRVTEQIDALHTLATNPIHYLIVPRFIAGLITIPLLCGIANIVGIFGGYLIAVKVLGVNGTIYMINSWAFLTFSDISNGLIKAAFFGVFIAIIGCYSGFNAEGGAEGVGKSTTKSVVNASMAILISDYFLTAILFR
jgi:phospholipid/cholesterol/gamma-HCH transport system permease protein